MSGSETRLDNTTQLRDEALCRSVLYGAISLAFHPPTLETLDELRSEKARLALPQAAALLGSGQRLGNWEPVASEADETSIDLAARMDDWMQTFQPLTLERLISAYGHLFGHTAKGLICPYEAEYGQEGLFQQPRHIARVAGFYQAFGLKTRDAERERADHISCELEFLDFLSRKEAFALERGEIETLEETKKAIRLFLRDHLARFGRAFSCLLREQDPEGFFGKLGDLLFDFVTFECWRLRIQPGPPVLRLRSAEPDNVPMACEGESDLVQLETPE